MLFTPSLSGASVLFSAFIDNIPYVATMLPVVQKIALDMGVDPTVLYFGLLSGATLGGNLTPIGASANITSIGILRKAGYEVQNRDFMRIGIPLPWLPSSRHIYISGFSMEFEELVCGKNRKVSGTRQIFLAACWEICYHIPNKNGEPIWGSHGE